MTDKKILGANEKYNYDLAVKYLDIVLLAPRTVRLLKDDVNFDQIINRTINIVAYYEDNYETPSENYAKFAQAYRTLTGKENTQEPNFDYRDASNVLDTINYITVFVKNMTGLTWQEVENSLRPKEVESEYVEQKTENNSEATSNTVNNEAQEPPLGGQNTSSGYNFNTMAGNYYGASQDTVSDSIIMQQAALLLNRRILNGKVYQYKDKPLIIPIMKYIMVAALILLTIISLVSFIILAYLGHNTHLVGITGSITQSANNMSIDYNYGSANWPGSIYFPYQFIFFLFISIFAGLIILRGNKNDNFKYRFPWGWILFYIILILLLTFINSGTTSYMVFKHGWFMQNFYLTPDQESSNSFYQSLGATDRATVQSIYDGNKPYVGCVNAICGLQYFIYAIIALCIVVLIVAIVFNPKKDIERLQNLVQQYADDIRYGRVSPEDFEGSNSSFGSYFGMF